MLAEKRGNAFDAQKQTKAEGEGEGHADSATQGEGEGESHAEGETQGGEGEGGDTKPRKLKIRLADGKVRELQSMTSTYFYVDGKPISAEEFLQKLFKTLQLPSLFGSEEKLREIWANPLTRRDLMSKLEKEPNYLLS